MYKFIGKRLLDLALTAFLLPLAVVPMAIVAGLIRVRMGAPIVFRSIRPGWHGELFMLYKFRTMTNVTDRSGQPLPDNRRVTPLGRVLRRTSLDELPQLINVLRGDMSLVGPRPLLVDYLSRYTPEQARRHDVRPGITGLAQVSGRNTAAWERKFERDVYYVDHVSLALDMTIMLRTAIKVLRRADVSAEGDVDVPPFVGIPANVNAKGER
jgi:lipopolysaccharide/colanic/teichoic acid biosynthesis glycosyltransferase